MDPWQLLQIKRSILGSMNDKDKPKPGLIDEALEQVSRIDTEKYKRVRIIFEYEFDSLGNASDSLEIRYRRPWK